MTRTRTAIDQISDDYVQLLAALNPGYATAVGIPGYDGEMSDFSPTGLAKNAALDRATLEKLNTVDVEDDVDAVTLAALRERLGLNLELFDANEGYAVLNVIASPLQEMRQIFDMMGQDTQEQWENIASRLGKLPQAMDGYIESLRYGAAHGLAPAARQVAEGVKQATELSERGSFFDKLADTGGKAFPELTAKLKAGADGARAAYAKLVRYFQDELAPVAPEKDGVGEERYRRFSRFFLGTEVDLQETYEWGIAELRRIIAEQQKVAEQIAGPGATVAQAVAKLESDEKYTLHGVDNLKTWMQATSDQAIAELGASQFDIPEEIRNLECMIAPTQDGGIYYTPPSDDLSRPGRMWWSVPPGVEDFGTWREKTTVYHEGVPGHHLQLATAVMNRDQLNDWRRLGVWVSGHGEGWALYAEKLMDELGYLSDAADRLGMLDGQRMRAARVVFDIGMHLGLDVPAALPGVPADAVGKPWTAAAAWEFLKANISMPEEFIRFEYNRYLGWPGQAPAYKIGQRIWEQARDTARAAAEARGETFDIRKFHHDALALGAVPLDVLEQVLAV
ncbi:MAG: DUF885 domain-containing protein [Promicromonosporaceae bacterium]|nr:DUF885 domain-containing protein [Promicromonosporaceae bacterium]